MTLTAAGQTGSSSVSLSAPTPVHTTYETCSGSCTAKLTDGTSTLNSPTITVPVNSPPTGPVSVALGNLTTGDVRVLTFTVKVNE